MQFKNFLDLEKLKKSVCLEENFNWVKSISLPEIELGLPSIKKTSKILFLNDKINPIYVELADGSKLFFTYDEFKRIQGKTPMIGKKMNVTMQRLGSDTSKHPSVITSCEVL